MSVLCHYTVITINHAQYTIHSIFVLTESKELQSLVEKNKAYSEAWKNLNEGTKEQYNEKARIEEAEKHLVPQTRKELINNALIKLQEHVCKTFNIFLATN